MDDAHVSAERLASATGRDASEVSEWVSGSSAPQTGDLKKAAALLGRSVQFFFRTTPPKPVESVMRFRSAVQPEIGDFATQIQAFNGAARLQRILGQAAEGQRGIQLPHPALDPAEYAETVRQWLDWDVGFQRRATSKSAVFKELRRRIEEQDIAVILRDMGEGNCRGFSIPSYTAPLIAVNSAYKGPAIRMFTLLHELGHIAHGEQAACLDSSNDEERWCDSFAANFLLPEHEVREYFSKKKWNWVDADELGEKVRLTSNRFKASWQCVAIRLRELDLAGQELVDAALSSRREANEMSGFAPGGGRHTPELRLDEFGSTVVHAVLRLRDSEKLTEFDARRILDVNEPQLATIRSVIGGGF